MPIAARRVFRLSLAMSIALATSYGMDANLPFIAPLFAFLLGADPKPPMGLKGLLGLILVLSLMLGSGLLLIPILTYHTMTGLIIVLLGLFFANYLSLNKGKGPVGLLLTIGITLISALGVMGPSLAMMIISALLLNIAIAVVCQWLVYPWFPEDNVSTAPPPHSEPLQSSWLALRATLVVFPSYLLVLYNPTAYAPIVMKSVALGQQANETAAKHAGVELLGSTCLAAVFAMVFWFCLKLVPNLFMFWLWTLLFSGFLLAKFYGVLASAFGPTFWQNVTVTLFILVGPAVEDTINGKDPYVASAVRIALFIGVTLYAWMMLLLLENLRKRQALKRQPAV
ncbi:DUF2955 domain-containing protein [Seongchinamella unica]|uniref:DUF2955 domain-containing protein n=1 Tax=Seongchinamella unica TaxID=2547392 RepID=A0A4R5LP33_9GAMM|nr:DUF2955 domain-containing protein [Seongchinamella unica]TDG12050.1 DUF2955 domain-containing protein [Seongchinamella unica]